MGIQPSPCWLSFHTRNHHVASGYAKSDRPPHFPMAQELWHSLRSDDAQRAALRAIAKHCTKLTSRQKISLLWAIDAAGQLSEYRNDAIHTAFGLYYRHPQIKKSPIQPYRGAGHPKRIEKLERVGYAKLFRALIGDLNQLSGYVLAIYLGTKEFDHPVPSSLPRRPVMRSVLLVQQSPPAKASLRAPLGLPKRQRQPSGVK